MKKSIFIIGTIGCFLFFSCENQNEKGTEDNIESTTQESTAQDEHHEDAAHLEHTSETLELNNGEKWEVNEEMRPHVAAEEEILKNYKSSDSTDYKALADELVKENSNLINSCTMKGENHEELHKWLHPHMELLDELGKSASNDQAEKVISKLEKSFEIFHQYFK